MRLIQKLFTWLVKTNEKQVTWFHMHTDDAGLTRVLSYPTPRSVTYAFTFACCSICLSRYLNNHY